MRQAATAEAAPAPRALGLFGLALTGANCALWPGAAPAGAGPCVTYREAGERELERRFASHRATRLSLVRGSEGEPDFFVDRDPDGRYSLWARSYGSCVIEPDGGGILAAPAADALRWRAFVLGQVLPICAVLQGLEVFHASAVVQDAAAVAFVAPSGVGKTSVAVRAALAGAALLTDDVLAVSTDTDGRVIAHPGAPVASLRTAEYDSLSPAERARLGRQRSRRDERVSFDVRVHDEPVPLRAICFLERVASGDRIQVLPVEDPRLLLGSSFVFVVQDGARLERQLDLCARLSDQTELVRVQVPPHLGAAAVARALEDVGA